MDEQRRPFEDFRNRAWIWSSKCLICCLLGVEDYSRNEPTRRRMGNAMAFAAHEEMVYSPDSIEFRDMVQSMLSKRLRALAAERARSQSRHEITVADFKASLKAAVDDVLNEFRVPGELIGGQEARR